MREVVSRLQPADAHTRTDVRHHDATRIVMNGSQRIRYD